MYSACADVGMTIVHPREYNGFRCSHKFARKRAKMVRYANACEKARSEGRKFMTFRAGYSLFDKVSPADFRDCFWMSVTCQLDFSVSGYVTVSWFDEDEYFDC